MLREKAGLAAREEATEVYGENFEDRDNAGQNGADALETRGWANGASRECERR